MAMTLNRNKRHRYGRLLCCLLLAAAFLSQWAASGSGEAGVQTLNASGNRNQKLAVDPTRKNEGFLSVLYNNRNGLPTSEANAIAQTDDGFLWIGSYAGLIRYDGSTFERIDSTTGIANVRSLYVDSHDRLWIGTNDSGLYLMQQGSFRKWDKSDGLSSASIRLIVEDEDGVIYIVGATGGIAMIDAEFRLSVLEDERLGGLSVRDLRMGSDGLLYGVTVDEDLFAVKDGKLVYFLSCEENRVKGLQCILPDPARPGYLYLGTDSSRIYYGNLENNLATLGIKDVSPLTSIKGMEVIDGQIWICALNGIGKLDAEGFHLLKNVPLNNSIEQMMTDYEGNLWFISSRQGVMKIVPDQFSDLYERYDLPTAVVNCTCMVGKQLFIGTDTGLTVIDNGEILNSIPLTKAETASGTDLETTDLLEYLQNVRIRSVIQDSKGRVWISTWRKYGLLCYDRGELTAYSQEDGLFSNTVRVISEWEDGSILVANTGGVNVIRDGRVTAGYGEEDGIVNGGILTVTEGFNHEIILGSDGDGIYIIGPDGTRRIGQEEGLNSEIVMRIKRSSVKDIFWIVTGNSLAYMTPDYQVTTVQQFPYPNNYDLYENSKGDLWVLSSSGIYVVPVEEMLANGPIEPVFYGMQSGLPYVATANSYSELTADGDLYIASTEGVVKVNVEEPFENISDLKVTISYIDADGVRYYPDASGEFTLPGNVQKLTVYPHVFNYSLIDPQVSFRLDGFDSADTTVSRSKLVPVDYTNLTIGAYDFIMTVKDPVGHSEQTVSFRIVKGIEVSAGRAGTCFMDIASLFLMGGMLVYTTQYRKRERLEDRLFFSLLLANAAMAVGELLSYGIEYKVFPFAKELMITGNTVVFVALVLFPYLLFVYLDYCADPNRASVRNRKLIFGIPFFLFAALMVVNLKTGWIFSIEEGCIYKPGFLDDRFSLSQLPVLFYLLISLIKMYKVNIRLAAIGFLLIAVRMAWELWFRGISSTSFIYTLLLVCLHLYEMNRPIYEEAS